MINKINIGTKIENLAAIYLIKQKLTLIERNFRSKFGEIDLIFTDLTPDQLIFTEVRYRNYTYFGEAAETINKTKQKKLIATAKHYLNVKYHNQEIYCRFDVVACTGNLDNIKINWIKNAFY